MNAPPAWLLRAAPTDPNAVDQWVSSPARLAAVASTGLDGSEPEESFDSLTKLAARLLKVPASFISVVGADRDFYKSQVGFPEPLAQARALPGRTFCHYTLAADQVLVIDDTHADPVWRAVPTVQTLGVRAYVGVPLRVGGETVGSFCVIDMEPRRWSDEELETLRQLAISAGRELGLRAALAEARADSEDARALARSREEVVAVVAHDLRTPLQILQLSATLLQRQMPQEQRPVIGRMVKAIDSMKSMAEGLLSSSALLAPSAGRSRAVGASELARDAVAMMAPIAERAGIELQLSALDEASISIDYARMLRVLGNVIGNAIKYSPSGTAVLVGATRMGAELLLTVTDQGRGMTATELERAFDSGWQGAEGMVRGDGAGLGLFIVRTLVEEHGGRVEIASQPGLGTALTVVLPCQ
ncbi:GAF domain-containing sensor histidine kinase [Caenimonas terrae]|uniref:histidine kinase n=1 Tax=Caenimonas terrae TaxID=696074 RepID=A0ABW0NIH6_9BURK